MRNRERLKIGVGIKYCGGCDPKYDRVRLVGKLKYCLKEDVDIVSYINKKMNYILIIAGCETACVDTGMFEGFPIYIIKQVENAEYFISYVKEHKIAD